MPARKPFDDVQHLKNITEKNVEMLITMHEALSKIACCEVSLDGGIAQKHIAIDALLETQKIVNNLEVKNA